MNETFLLNTDNWQRTTDWLLLNLRPMMGAVNKEGEKFDGPKLSVCFAGQIRSH
jgi:hypothetical protein